ncbi:MAG: hypothetical protein IJH62_06670 [Mogibacterium sp.]|nr:hypothetical protein [Mogibacterium sp.]
MEGITKERAVIPADPMDTARAKRIDQYRIKLEEMKWRNAKDAECKRIH